MIRVGITLGTAGFLFGFGALRLQAEPQPSPAPDFHEVYDIIKEHLTDINEVDLNRFAVQGLLAGLHPSVTLVSGGTNASAAADSPLVSRSTLFEGKIAYLRIARVQEGLPKALQEAIALVASTNELNGLVLDLRFAEGDDYSAAAATAGLFLKKERPLLDWGQGVVQSKEREDAIAVPVTTLVNRKTAGAAEALAGVLREAGSSLILGSNTAGQAMIAQDYPLKNGDRLRIASGPVRLGDGSVLPAQGLKPDIRVEVAPLAEQSYYADAFKEVSKATPAAGTSLSGTNSVGVTNRAHRPRFNEAELVRERKLGAILDSDLQSGSSEPEKPIVQDPVLARALDVLKGLTLVRQAHS